MLQAIWDDDGDGMGGWHAPDEVSERENAREMRHQKLLRQVEASPASLLNLRLPWQRLGDHQVAVLAELLEANTRIAGVDLRGNNMGISAVEALVSMLGANETLTALELGSNPLGDSSGRALARCLSENRTLTYLGTGSADFTSEAAESLGGMLRANTHLTCLDLSANALGAAVAEEHLLPALYANRTLTDLDIEHCAVPQHLRQTIGAQMAFPWRHRPAANPIGPDEREAVVRMLEERAAEAAAAAAAAAAAEDEELNGKEGTAGADGDQG